MGRARLSENFLVASSSGGSPTLGSGRSVYVYKRGTTTPITETMYSTETGSTVLTQPLTMDNGGTVKAWKETAEPVSLLVSGVSAAYDADFTANAASLGQISGGTAKFDGQLSQYGTTTSGSNLLTLPIRGAFTGFTSADVGKHVEVIQLTALNAVTGGYVETNVAHGTITTVVSTTQVLMSVNASATTTYDSNSINLPNGSRVFWGTDDTAALQALFDTVQGSASPPGRGSLGSSEIRLPEGIAMATALDLTSRQGVRLVGAGGSNGALLPMHGTMLVGIGSGQTLLKTNGTSFEMVGIGLDGAGKISGTGIDLTTTGGYYDMTFRQCQVNGFGTGINGSGNSYNAKFDTVKVTHCTNGWDFRPTGNDSVQKLYLDNSGAEQNSGVGLIFGPNVNLAAMHGGNSQNNAYGVRLTGGASSSGPDAIRFTDCHFEGNFTRTIDIVKSGGQYGAIASSFIGCAFYGGGAGFTGTMVHSDGALYVSFDHPVISTWPTGSTIWDFTGTSTNSFGNVVGIDAEYIGVAGTVYGNTKGLSVGYGVSARFTASGDQSIANGGSGTFLAWDTVVTDPYQGLTSATIFTIPVSGNYRITGAATVGASASGTYRVFSIYVDAVAVEIAYKLPSTVVPCDFHLSTELPLTAGQTVRLNMLIDAAGLSVTHGAYGPWLVVTRLP